MEINLLFSGGSDSTFSMFFLKKVGHRVYCNFIKVCPKYNKNINREIFNCYFLSKKNYSEFRIVDLIDKYKKKVFCKMIENYKKGRTPNPDIVCNKKIKFCNFFFKKKVNSSGHYTIKKKDMISMSIDFKKDQTYFLSLIESKKIKNTLFPIGVFYKKEIIFFIFFLNLNKTINKKSRGVCFLNYEKKFSCFISKYIKEKCNIFYKNKNIAKKKMLYKTIGQKVYIEGKGSFYLADKNKESLFLVKKKSNTLLYKRIFITKKFDLKRIDNKRLFLSKTSSTSLLLKCFLYIKNKKLLITFIRPIIKISEGQSLSFFLKKIQVGYAII
ncbi:tRNA-specific 2-thiouridylase MnmA [Candidatus Vidania fulgoroideae]|nr:tRNA-specific 2-thiouridylase MnmA [Candidatus Vidania fulgoroideae]